MTFSVNFGTRFENRHGSNTNESSTNYDIFARINHTPGWIFPVSYEVQNGETTKTLYGGTAVYQDNVVAALSRVDTIVEPIPSMRPTSLQTTRWTG